MDTRAEDLEGTLREALAVAAELATSLDIDATLKTVVKRTRHLLRSDMAYVSINDSETNMTYIRESEGVATAEYRTIQMPVGTGILGQVASGIAPYQTQDYLNDDSMEHIPEIDRIVAREGVSTVMGVPLIVGSTIIGALMVAERRPRVFSPAHVDIVDSFGRLVALALKQAEEHTRSVARQRRLEDSLNRATAEVAVKQADLDFGRHLRETLASEMTADCLVRETAQAIGSPVALYSSHDELLSAHDGQTPGTFEMSMSTPWLGELQASVEIPKTNLKLAYSEGLDFTSEQLIEIAATHVPLARILLETTYLQQNKQDAELLTDLLSETKHATSEMLLRLRSRGITSGKHFYLGLLDISEPAATKLEPIIRQHPKIYMVAQRAEGLCVLFADIESLEDLVTSLQNSAMQPTINGAYSGPAYLGSDLKRHLERARSGLLVLQYSSYTGLLDSSEVGLLGEVLKLSASPEHRADVVSPLAPLFEHDSVSDTALTRTALAYFENDKRIDLTANHMFVHRNTIKQRLKKITGLLGSDWDKAPRSLDLHWALRAWSWS
jgi:hypothetical protein